MEGHKRFAELGFGFDGVLGRQQCYRDGGGLGWLLGAQKAEDRNAQGPKEKKKRLVAASASLIT